MFNEPPVRLVELTEAGTGMAGSQRSVEFTANPTRKRRSATDRQLQLAHGPSPLAAVDPEKRNAKSWTF